MTHPSSRLALHDRHAAEGATFVGARGWELPAWYDAGLGGTEALAREYAAGREAAALVDLSDRGLIVTSGPLRQKFLHNILSNVVEGLAPGQGCSAALMNSKGHLLALLRVLVTTDSVLLETPPDRAAAVEETLTRYRVAAPVRFERRPAAFLGVLGPGARELLRAQGANVPELAADAFIETSLAGRPVRIVRASDLPADGYLMHLEPEHAVEVWPAARAAGAVAIGRQALDALRIEDGQPWFGHDVDEDNLLHETGLIRRYHEPAKGCYVGQEVVARLEARGGHVNKRVCGLRLTQPSRAGAMVRAEGREVGLVTTASVSPRFGPIAMGMIHRSRFEAGSVVEVDGAPATIAGLPLVASPVLVAGE